MMSRSSRHVRPAPGARSSQGSLSCVPWVALLPDAAEGLLNDAEQRALDTHLSGCASCAEELAEAQRGLAWLHVLKEQSPEPPATMLASILARTTGYAEAGVSLPELPPYLSPADISLAAEQGSRPTLENTGRRALKWLRGDPETWSSLLQPRLAMTGAMAFFSICLTLNLLGISLAQLDPQSLRHGSLHRTVAETGTSLRHSLEGLRVVYRVESRVNELHAGASPDAPAH